MKRLLITALGLLGIMSSALADTNWYQPYLDSMGQNLGRAKPAVDCNKPLAFAGGINFDYRSGNRYEGYMGENTERYSLNDAYLDAFGRVNSMVNAFVELSYNNTSIAEKLTGSAGANGINPNRLDGQYSNVYPGTANGQSGISNIIGLQQAYITLGDLNRSPFFVQLGRQFEDYGRYQIHAMTRTFTQVLTETLRTSANLGFVIPCGLHGQVFLFDTPEVSASVTGSVEAISFINQETHSGYTYGASLGFDQFCDQLGYGVNLSYLSNMVSVNDISFAVLNQANQFTPTRFYAHAVGAIALNGHINTGPFSFILNYTTALQNFNPFDLRSQASSDPSPIGNVNSLLSGIGAKPWALDATANYAFNAWFKDQNVYLGYQTGGDLALIPLPSSRWLVGYNIDLMKTCNYGINLGLEWTHDIAYSASKTRDALAVSVDPSFAQYVSGNSDTLGFRAAVKFG